jgi:hypothetical protein
MTKVYAWVDRQPRRNVTATVATFDGTAIAGRDFVPMVKTLTFTRKQHHSVVIPIQLLAPQSPGRDLSFGIRITNATSATLGTSAVTVTIHWPPIDPRDTATQAELQRALGDEDAVRASTFLYSANFATMKAADPTLDWGGRLIVVVGDAMFAGDEAAVCLTEASPTGTTFSIAEVARGGSTGTYYGKTACPAAPTPANLSALGAHW